MEKQPLKNYLIKGVRALHRKVSGFKPKLPVCEMDRQKANNLIFDLLSSEKPCMISRFGTGEIGIIVNYLGVHNNKNLLNRILDYVTSNKGLPWWDKIVYKTMRMNAGIFPESTEILENFSKRYLADIPQIDLLGSFNETESLMPLRKDVVNVHLECLYPFFVEKPWTRVLKGKRVLVIHPFVETIVSQHKNHTKIFSNQDVFPDYILLTLKAVQSNAGAEVPFKDWFDALKHMENQISKLDFDFAIIGCGAYGLPLAAYVKRMGKKAIHLGGGSQLLFGIKGKRWDDNAYHWKNLPELDTNYSKLYNENWVRPSSNETPKSANSVEGACYW